MEIAIDALTEQVERLASERDALSAQFAANQPDAKCPSCKMPLADNGGCYYPYCSDPKEA